MVRLPGGSRGLGRFASNRNSPPNLRRLRREARKAARLSLLDDTFDALSPPTRPTTTLAAGPPTPATMQGRPNVAFPDEEGDWHGLAPTKAMVGGRAPLLVNLLAGLQVFEGDHAFEVAVTDKTGKLRHFLRLDATWTCTCATFAAAGTCPATALVHLVRATNEECWK